MDLLDHFPNALANLKQVLASLVLPISEEGEVVPLVDPLAYENAQCIADYDNIITALSGFLEAPEAALMYAGCSKAPLVLCWLASHDLVDHIKANIGGLLMSAHRLLAEYKVTGIAVGDQTYKCPTLKVRVPSIYRQ